MGRWRYFADYQCTPGIPVDFYQEGNTQCILISLRETRNRGDEETFHSQRHIQNGFVSATEYFMNKINHRTHSFQMRIIFPKKRSPKRVVLIEQHRKRTQTLDSEHIHTLPDGRIKVEWQTRYPRLHELYGMKWEW